MFHAFANTETEWVKCFSFSIANDFNPLLFNVVKWSDTVCRTILRHCDVKG